MTTTHPPTRPQTHRRASSDTQVSYACKEMMRYLHRSGLKRGDHLPTQAELQRAMKLGSATISAAMGLLVDGGAIKRQRRVGTVVVDPDQLGYGYWTVGLVSILPPPEGGSSFVVDLSQRIHAYLLEIGCRCQMYMRLSPPADKPAPCLEDFDETFQDLQAHRLDALVVPVWSGGGADLVALDRQTPLVHVGGDERFPCAVVIEQKAMASQATNLLLRHGCRRLAVVNHSEPETSFRSFWQGLSTGLSHTGLIAGKAECLHEGFGIAGGRRVAQLLLSRPASQRPDGLIVLNDWVALGLTSGLREAGGGYRPRMTVQVNRQMPLTFSLPVFRFEVDADQLARTTVQLVTRRLVQPRVALGLLSVPPQLAGETDAEALPTARASGSPAPAAV